MICSSRASVVRALLALLLALSAGACAGSRTAPLSNAAPPPDAVADSATAAQRGYLGGFAAFLDDGSDRVHALVEIPAGTSEKWMVSEEGPQTGRLVWERRPSGERRVVQYLAYPVNYGIVPRTAAGDGDPLDVLVLGPALPRGSVWAVRPIGVLRLTDDGAHDDKILTVRTSGPPGTPFAGVRTLEDLRRSHPGVTEILRTWFTNYKGASGALEFGGYGAASEARQSIRDAATAFEE